MSKERKTLIRDLSINAVDGFFYITQKLQAEIRELLTQKREPLSDETIAKLWGESYSGTTQMVRNFARAIEKAHGIGGGE